MNSPKSNTPLLSNNKNSFNHFLSGDQGKQVPGLTDTKHVEKMKQEFLYLDAYLRKLSKKSAVERFKYYAKKRINFYFRLLTSKSDRVNFGKSALSLINKIAKRLDSTVTKITKLFQKSDTDIEKYLQRSHVSRNYDKNNKGVLLKDHENIFLKDESSLKKRTLIHLKRYLAKIPPTNIEEFKAFKNLFENRAEADKIQNSNQNVKNIKNTLAFRINKKSSYTNNIQERKRQQEASFENKLKKKAQNEANRHLRIVAGHKLKPKLFSTAKKLKAKKEEEAKQRLERFYREEMLKRTAMEENEETERILTRRRDAASLRLQSMGRMRSAKHRTNKIRSRKREKRKSIEERLTSQAEYENRVQRSIERRREAQRRGHERQVIRNRNARQRSQAEDKVRDNLYEGRMTNNPEVRQKVMAQEVAKALAASPQRLPRVRQQAMKRSPPASATASVIFVTPHSNGRIVTTPGFNANQRNNKMIVVRAEDETWGNTLKRARNDFRYHIFGSS